MVVVCGRKRRRDWRGVVVREDPLVELTLKRLTCLDDGPSDIEPIAESAGVDAYEDCELRSCLEYALLCMMVLVESREEKFGRIVGASLGERLMGLVWLFAKLILAAISTLCSKS